MPGDANSSQWHRISWPLSGVAGGTPAGGGVCPTGLFPAGVPTGWPHPSADALCPIPAGLGVASGFPVARLLLCSVSPPPPLSAVPSNPFSAAPSESAAGRCWPRLAPAGTRPPRSRPGACVRGLPEPPPHARLSFRSGDRQLSVQRLGARWGRVQSLGDPWDSRQLDTPGRREDPRVSAV